MLVLSRVPLMHTMEAISWSDLNIVQTLRDKAAEFSKAYNYLIQAGPIVKKHPELAPEYNALLSRGTSIRSSVTALLTQVESVIKTITSLIPGMSGLEILPAIIPIAIILGSIALITKWVADYITFNKKLQQIQQLTAQGISPERAVSIVTQAAQTPGLLGQLISPQIGWIIMGGIAIYIFASVRR